MNGISAAELGKSELEVGSDEFTETRGAIYLHSEALWGVRNGLDGLWAEEADVGSTIVLVHHSSHEGNETHYVVDYYVVVNNMWAGGKREEGKKRDGPCM